ncbi:chemotaxis protein [Paenibacillus selenitireducens]|uniref:Chemotaxis protein n=2 Tax=Paenibacillus selenitireducens TaxID=1324314 RepID=A0A1T2X0X9_9BACL|nr:methyl-accepting chemotaxis protein [Paenibacillus selenitireducens]OPA73568.1 chemotaxis protein [Paenibacillus selenitireducens]
MKMKLKKLASNNFKTKLLSTFVLILVVPSMMIGILAYNQAHTEMDKQIMLSAANNVKLIDSIISSNIQPKMDDVDYLSKKIQSSMYKGQDSPEVSSYFDTYMGMHPEASIIALGTDTGLYIRSPKQEVKAGFDPRTRDWYKIAMASKGEAIITNPYISVNSGKTVVTIAKTTADGTGVISIDLSMDYIKKLTSTVSIGKNGYVMILDQQQKFVVHPTEKAGTAPQESFYGQMYKLASGQFGYELEGQANNMMYTTNYLTGWKVAGSMPSAEIEEATKPIYMNNIIVIALCLLVGFIIIYFVLKSIIRPITQLKNHAVTVSQGILTEEITIHSDDEIGHLGRAFRDMQQNLRSLIQEVEQRAILVSASSDQLTASAEQTSEATEQVTMAVQEIASSAEKQTTGVDHTAQALNEVSQGVVSIVDRVQLLSDLSKHATEQAVEGGASVGQVVAQMNSIQDSVAQSDRMIKSLYERSKQIGAISDIIREISQQTNLLALNAAIEAARAGENGRGFAVVADEVRKLAEQSQGSAQQITDLIQEIQRETRDTVDTMEKVTQDVEDGLSVSNATIHKFEFIMSSMQETSPHIDEVSAITQQISAGIQEVTAVANELAMIAKGNAATSEEVAASAEEQLASMEEISASAQSLSSLSDELKQMINRFTY